MAEPMTATLGPAFPPARGSQGGAPTPTRQLMPGRRPVLRSRLGGPAGGDLYTAIGPASLAALARINSKVRRSHASKQRTTDLTHRGE